MRARAKRPEKIFPKRRAPSIPLGESLAARKKRAAFLRRAFNCCAAPPMRIAAVRSAFAAFSLKRAANRGDAGKPRGEIYFPRIFLQRAFIHCLASPARKTCGSLRIAGAKNKRPKKLRRRVSMPPRFYAAARPPYAAAPQHFAGNSERARAFCKFCFVFPKPAPGAMPRVVRMRGSKRRPRRGGSPRLSRPP